MLNKKAKSPGQNIFVPYRNSMMTMVLRDSLGGNCKTKMVATVSGKKEDLYESLSTCRFAKNVSLIQNKVSKNESVDPGVIISRLKKEIAELKAELAIAKGGEQKDHLTSEDIERCNLMVKDFIDTSDPHKTLVLPDRLLINQCFYHFKTLYKGLEKKKGGVSNEVKAIKDDTESEHKTQTTDKINLQQESEINRLNMLVK
jgi:kinesin family protein 6/9